MKNIVLQKIMLSSKKIYNVLQLGIGFGLLYAAIGSSANIQQFVMSSVITDRNGTGPPIDSHAGYVSSAIVYACLMVFNFIAPPIVSRIKEKWSMVLGATAHLILILSFFYVTNILYYICSALSGCGAAFLWVGQGTYLTKNSTAKTANRNSGIFWALYQTSLIVGGMFVYFELLSSDTNETPYLSSKTITTIYISFSILASCGVLVLALLRKPKNFVDIQHDHNLAVTFFRTIKLMATKQMLLLSVVFAFTGMELTFYTGVYGTSIADTLAIPSHKKLLALNTIFVGIGEILGSSLCGVFGKKLNRLGRIPTIILAMIIHMTAFLLIFLNIPSVSPIYETNDIAFINPPNQYLALLCSILLGFADSCWQTQLYSSLASYYTDDDAPAAFGLFNFYSSAASCCAYFYSSHLTLQWQILILAIVCPIAAVSFVNVQFLARAKINSVK